MINMNWATLLLALGALAVFLTVILAKDKGLRMKLGWVFGIVAIFGLAGLLLPAQLGFLQGNVNFGGSGSTLSAGDVQAGQNVDTGIASACVETTRAVVFSGTDEYLSTAVGGSHAYRVGNNPIKTVADGASVTLGVGTKIDILWTNASLTGYFPQRTSYTVPCTGDAEAS